MSKTPTLQEVQHWRQMTESESLRGVDLCGKDVTLTIKNVIVSAEFHGAGGKAKKMPALEFERTDKKLGLCTVNMATIAMIHGPKPADWIGKRITLFPQDGTWFGERKPAVRIRPTAPKQGAATATAASEPDDGDMSGEGREPRKGTNA